MYKGVLAPRGPEEDVVESSRIYLVASFFSCSYLVSWYFSATASLAAPPAAEIRSPAEALESFMTALLDSLEAAEVACWAFSEAALVACPARSISFELLLSVVVND